MMASYPGHVFVVILPHASCSPSWIRFRTLWRSLRWKWPHPVWRSEKTSLASWGIASVEKVKCNRSAFFCWWCGFNMSPWCSSVDGNGLLIVTESFVFWFSLQSCQSQPLKAYANSSASLFTDTGETSPLPTSACFWHAHTHKHRHIIILLHTQPMLYLFTLQLCWE